MRISPQVSAASIVALGHFNPLIFRPDWLKDKEILIGNDFENLKILIVHPDIVSYELPWGNFQADRENFTITATREPLMGINRDVQFETASEAARDHVGDMLAPKDFWGDFVKSGSQKAGGMRSLVMEQSIQKGGRRIRIDGKFGYVWARVEPSVRQDIHYGIFMQVNDHFDLVSPTGSLSDGRVVGELIAEQFQLSITNSDRLIDRVMELADARA